jgi:hypothetical protein
MSQDSQDSQERVPAAVQVFGDYKLLVKILSWISGIPGFPGFPKGTRGPLLVRLGGTCRGVRRAAATLVDQRTIERIVALMPTWQWVDFSAAYGQVGPDSGPEESTLTSRVRALVRAQEPRWWVACPFRLHDLNDIARSIETAGRWEHSSWYLQAAQIATRILSRLRHERATRAKLHDKKYDYIGMRLLDTKRPSVKAVESVEKLRELLLDPINPKNVEEYGATEAYDIRDLKSLTSLKFVRDTDVTFWDTSHVTDMSYMAQGLVHSLSGIEHWNTSRVTSMEGAFSKSGFNQDIGRWDTTRVTTMSSMFTLSGFNQDIGRWGTSSVRHMISMFEGATAFNQDIGKWDVGQVVIMNRMFSGASAFDHDISAWATGSVSFAPRMLDSCPIREAHMPPIGLTIRGPRATELRPELARLIDELGLSYMSLVCVDTSSGPIRVSLNRTILLPATTGSSDAAREMRAKVQDKLLRCICGFYGGSEGSSEVPEAPKGKGQKGRGPVTVQFNWTAPLDRPRPWTWTCGSTDRPEPLEPPGPLETERSKCTVS